MICEHSNANPSCCQVECFQTFNCNIFTTRYEFKFRNNQQIYDVDAYLFEKFKNKEKKKKQRDENCQFYFAYYFEFIGMETIN